MTICAYAPCQNELSQPPRAMGGRPRKYCSKSHANMASLVANPQWYMLRRARSRAHVYGRECTITVDDIVIPSHCPILGIELTCRGQGGGGISSPTLDRIDNAGGYTPGNIHVISLCASSMKRDKSIRQLAAGHASPEWRSWARKHLGRPERRTVVKHAA